MSRPPTNPPMTSEEMALAARANAENKMYRGREQTAEINRALVGEIVGNMAAQMEAAADEARRFPLSDLDRVNAVAMEYVTACASAGALPTVTGAAAAMGRSRTALYKYGQDHPAFGEWLTEFSDSCGEAAAAAAIHGATAAIPTIFTLKARHQWRDTVSIETMQERRDPLKYEIDDEELRRKYADAFKDLPED